MTAIINSPKNRAWLDRMNSLPGVFFYVRTYSLANQRVHWAVVAKRAKEQRGLARCYCANGFDLSRTAPPTGDGHFQLQITPSVFVITRYGPRRLDSDGLAISMKHIRDGVADAYRIDDGDPKFTWEYRQEIAPTWGVRIEVKEQT